MITEFKIYEKHIKNDALYKFFVEEDELENTVIHFVNYITEYGSMIGGRTLYDDGDLFSKNTSFSRPIENIKSALYTSKEFCDKYGIEVCLKIYKTEMKIKETTVAPKFQDDIIRELMKIPEIKLRITTDKYNI